MGYHKIIKSGTQVESQKYVRSLQNFQTSGRPGSYDRGYRKNTARRVDNARRSVSAFRRLVRANCVGDQSPTLLTFTMLQIISLKSSWGIFTEFFDRFRDIVGKEVRYIAVPEFQKRGAVHFHVLVWGLSDDLILHEGSCGKRKGNSRKRFASWLAEKGYSVSQMRNDRVIQNCWRMGYVDCLPTDGSPALAFYLSDYLTPTLRDVRLGGERAYSYSRNVLRSVYTAAESFSDEDLEKLGVVGEPLRVREFNADFMGAATYALHDCTGYDIDESLYTPLGMTMPQLRKYRRLLIHMHETGTLGGIVIESKA